MESRLPDEPARVLVMVDQPLVADIIKLTLNHGVYLTQEARDFSEATEALEEWRPHLAVIDMDIGGDQLVRQMARANEGGTRTPVLALTRRGDLKTKLAAFDLAVWQPSSPMNPQSVFHLAARLS